MFYKKCRDFGMGQTRNNQPRAVTKQKILDRIRELLAAGQTTFPSERELAMRTGGSRSVIREILEELEQESRLVRTPHRRSINPETNRIPVLFVARGRNMIDNPTWARLWLALVNLAKGTPLAPELQLMRYWPEELEEDYQELSRRDAKYIILTNTRNLEPQIREWMEKKEKNIIFADEAYQHYGLPVVSLDNTRVGELAAEELFRNGFRSPALLTQDFSDHWYSPYLKRIQGFAAKCAELGMDYREERDCHRVFFEKSRLQSYIHQTEKIAEEKRYDSLFLTSDDQLPLVLEVLHDQMRFIPGELGMITLNSQNKALTGNTRVTAISSATTEIATTLSDLILAHADGRIREIPSKLIIPTIHKGETLCLRKGK